jgi:hypothetical protein
MTAFDIVAYDFKGERLCAKCVKTIVTLDTTGEGGTFEGWADATDTMGAEEFLQGIADAFQIDRVNPRTYDAAVFPKVVFRGHLHGAETCDNCGAEL